MNRIKKVNELFDSEEIKRLFPKGFNLSDFKNDYIHQKNQENELEKVLYMFPILENFYSKVLKMDDGTHLYTFFATSRNPITKNDDDTMSIHPDIYAQLAFAYDGKYHVNILLRERQDVNNPAIQDFTYDKIRDAYKPIKLFLDICIKYGIIEKEDMADSRLN